MINLEFCEKYKYPLEIRELFRCLLSPIDPLKVRSVILYGSSSFGEIGYCISDEDVKVYSDYDLFIIARGSKDKKYEKGLSQFYNALKQKYPNKFSNISFSYNDVSGLRGIFKKNPDIRFYIRNHSEVIFGEDLRTLIPPVELKEFTPEFKIDLLLGKLWRFMLSIPKEILVGQYISEEYLKKWTYVLCKLYLELIGWILNMEGILLITYREKIDYFLNHSSDLKAAAFFKADKDLLEECYSVKTTGRFLQSPALICSQIISQYLLTRKYLLFCFGSPLSCKESEFSVLKGLPTPDKYLSRRVYNIYLMLSRFRPFQPIHAVKWFSSDKYYLMFDYLYAMLESLYYHLKAEHNKALKISDAARLALEWLLLDKRHVKDLKSDDFSQMWLLLRRLSMEFLCIYFPSSKRRIERLQQTFSL